MAREIKHVGRVIATKRKCLVAYRTLPGDAYNCLIIATENLPDSYHDALINLVESPAGQAANEFAEVLDRSLFPDGSRMLPALHSQGRLLKVQTSAIEMTPTTATSIVLSELNQLIAEQRGVPVDLLAIQDGNKPNEPKVEETVKETATPTAIVEEATVTAPASFASPEDEAKYYRSQADKLSKQAAEMRRKAEELVPTKKATTK